MFELSIHQKLTRDASFLRARLFDVRLSDTSRPHVGVGILILNHHQEVLLSLRKRPPEADCWSITGGKVEFMETLAEAALREVLEETGLTVKLERLLCITDHLIPDENQHWVSPAYLAVIVSGELENLEPDATTELRFFALDDLPKRLTMTAQNALNALRST